MPLLLLSLHAIPLNGIAAQAYECFTLYDSQNGCALMIGWIMSSNYLVYDNKGKSSGTGYMRQNRTIVVLDNKQKKLGAFDKDK